MGIFKVNKNYLLLHFIVFIWGFAGIFGRAITLPATHLIWYRMFIASAGILLYLIIKKIPLQVKKKELLKFMAVGLMIAIHWIFFYGAIKVSNISVTLACFSSTALFTALVEPIFFKKKLNRIEILCGLIVILAISLIFKFEVKYKTGILLSVLSAITAALFTVMNAVLVKTNDSRVLSFYEIAFGFLGITAFLIFNRDFGNNLFNVSFSNWLLLIIFSIIGTSFTFVVSSELLKEISPYTVNLTVNLEVVYGIILAYLVFGEDERMTTGFYLSTFLILMVLFANAWLKQKAKSK